MICIINELLHLQKTIFWSLNSLYYKTLKNLSATYFCCGLFKNYHFLNLFKSFLLNIENQACDMYVCFNFDTLDEFFLVQNNNSRHYWIFKLCTFFHLFLIWCCLFWSVVFSALYKFLLLSVVIMKVYIYYI